MATSSIHPQSAMYDFLGRQAQQMPHAIAVEDVNQQLTYQQLEERTNQMAHYLQTQGVGPGIIVGLCADRSIDMVLGILGVLKAGGTYLPLDPNYPDERLHFMVQEAQPALLLSQPSFASRWQSLNVALLTFDGSEAAIAAQPITPPSSSVTPDHLAYILYTSGSTGRPKGVQMPRAVVTRYIEALGEVLPVQADDVYLHVASFSFSSSVRQLLVPLSKGARVVIANAQQVKDPLRLFALMQAAKVTVLDSVSSIWRYGLKALEALDTARKEALIPAHLRLLIVSGEQTSCALVQAIRQTLKGQPQIFNVYGQTETIGSTIYAVPTTFDRQTGAVPVGHPYAYSRAYILNEAGQEVAPGEIGELFMAGGCLSQGYLNRPELMAQSFMPNPWAERDEANFPLPLPTLFRTGDLARQTEDGVLELVGRVDFQVKLRGMRVEIEEIEATLEVHPHLEAAMVAARAMASLSAEDSAEDEEIRLVAYLVASKSLTAAEKTALIGELRQLVSDRLPEYMVPSQFVFLQAIPLTPNGKRDRKALPDPETLIQSETVAALEPPKGDLEIQLWDIWKLVLGTSSINVTDDFFELGGHSLLAAQMLAHVEQISGVRLPLATLVTAPTITQLADVLRQEAQNTSWPCLIPVQPLAASKHLFCVHGLFGNVMNFIELARALGPSYSVYGLQARGLDGRSPFFERIEDMAAFYIQEIRVVQPHGPYYLAGYSFGGNVAFEMAQQLTRQGEEVARVIMLDAVGRNFFRQVPLLEKLQNHARLLLKHGPSYVLDKVNRRAKRNTQQSGKTAQALFGIPDAPEGTTAYSAQSVTISQAHRQALRQYHPQPYDGDVVLIRAQLPDPDEAWFIDPALGWGHLVKGRLNIHYSSGYHVSMLKAPHVEGLAVLLQPYLLPLSTPTVKTPRTLQGTAPM